MEARMIDWQSVAYAFLITAGGTALARWMHLGSFDAGKGKAHEAASRAIDKHIDEFMDWYHYAPDIERLHWRKNEIHFYIRGLRNAQRILNEKRES
jgi:hypothetical protein